MKGLGLTYGNGRAAFYFDQYRQGKQQGCSFFFKAWYPALCRYAFLIVRSEESARDIAQDSFLNIWAKRSRFLSITGLRAYLYRSVYHAALRHNDQKQKHGYLPLAEIPDNADPTPQLIHTELERLLLVHINKLPAGCRNTLLLYLNEGLSSKEMATRLHCSASTVRNQKARAIRMLRKMTCGGGVSIFT